MAGLSPAMTTEETSALKLFLEFQKLRVAAVIAAFGDQGVGGLDVRESVVTLVFGKSEAGVFEMGIAFEETHAAAFREAHDLVEVMP